MELLKIALLIVAGIVSSAGIIFSVELICYVIFRGENPDDDELYTIRYITLIEKTIKFPFRFIYRYTYAIVMCKVIRKHAWIDVEHGKFTREGGKDYLQECEMCGKGKYYF